MFNAHGVSLNFARQGDLVELCDVTYKPCGADTILRSVRGKSCGAFRGAGTFQWTSAVQGLSVLMLRALAASKGSNVEPHLIGAKGSLASSLDYAISKGPLWIGEMFGVQESGNLVIRRLVLISNSNRKRPGPVVISVNERSLAASMIRVTIDDEEISSLEDIEALLRVIEQGTQQTAPQIHPFTRHVHPELKMAS